MSRLIETYRDLVAKLGPDPTRWRWGDWHRGYFEHALSNLAPQARLYAKGGSASTVMCDAYRAEDFRLVTDASVAC